MPDRSDVVIVGAGIIGASIAWRLAQAGAPVTLVDAGTLGGEASWAGAGMLAPGGEFTGRSRWAEFALESMALYPAFVARGGTALAKWQHDGHWTPTGHRWAADAIAEFLDKGGYLW